MNVQKINTPKLDIIDIFDKHLEDGDVVAVGVSGGGDSVAMLLGMQQFALLSSKDITIIALSVDHRLRDSSANEVSQVAKWCKKLGVKHQILEWVHDKKPASALQEKARNARYGLMCDYCIKHGIKKLFIAHNLEDNAETMLMRLRRGAGLRGLSSIESKTMRYVNEHDGVMLVRAFLNVKRADLRVFLRQHKQKWFEDASNENEEFERVRVRNFMIATDLFENEKIAQSAKRLKHANDALEHYLNIFWDEKIKFLQYGIAKISVEDFLALPLEMQGRLLARLVWSIGALPSPTRWQKIENLVKLLIIDKPQKHCLGNCFVILKNKNIWIGLENRQGTVFEPQLLAPRAKIIWQSRLIVENVSEHPIWIGAGSKHVKSIPDAPKAIMGYVLNVSGDDSLVKVTTDVLEIDKIKCALKIRY